MLNEERTGMRKEMYNKILFLVCLGESEQDDGSPVRVKRVKCEIV